jgi:ubiquinone/menaquinone biosynthesis C-methylase UbiE
MKLAGNGCGNGSFIYEKHKDKKIYTTDIKKRGLKNFKIANSTNLSFEDNKFDCVVFAGVIQYVKDYNKAIKEIHRILKDGGRLIISTVNVNSFFRVIKVIKKFPKKEFGEHNIFSLKEIEDLLIRHGFRIDKVIGVDMINNIPTILSSNNLIISSKP